MPTNSSLNLSSVTNSSTVSYCHITGCSAPYIVLVGNSTKSQ
ncbi:hypothetical protein [uncultured Clostridium sp.]|nr:hypothetical protein [uncultured Clostridium sp.]